MTTTVIHIRDADLAAGDVYIGREMPRLRLAVSPWANPYRITPTQPRERVIARYRWLLRERPDLMARISELRGKRLACWCVPRGETLTAADPLVCHGQVLAALADGEALP